MIKLFVFLWLLPTCVSTGAHSLWVHITYIKGSTQFSEFSSVLMLDDMTVRYSDLSNTYFPRGNTTNEDDLYDLGNEALKKDVYVVLADAAKRGNHTGLVVHQVLGGCELLDNDKPGRLILRRAFNGSTIDETHYFEGKFTYNGPTYTEKYSDPILQLVMWYQQTFSYPNCIHTLRSYLKKRGAQVKRKVKPRVRLIQKASDSGGICVSCLATGFYPRHLNLSLFRDGQPVSDHEVTGGDLLPNGDGTYQMRKSLEIRGDERLKHTYSCSATHLSLDNKLDVDLEFSGGTFKQVISSVLVVLGLGLVLLTVLAIIIWRKKQSSASSTSDYSFASSTDDNMDKN